jgi:SAM-dependent methyltransferase
VKVRDTGAQIDRAFRQAGIDIRRFGRSARQLPRFVRQFREYQHLARMTSAPVPRVLDAFPILGDAGSEAAAFDAGYFHQDLWAARKVRDRNPAVHFDIGSRVDGFIAHLLVFMEVTMLDIRPLEHAPSGLNFQQVDATSLPFEDKSIRSISSLHALEHFGLGRYGDSIDPLGCERALRELSRVAAPGGRVYIGLPIGSERTIFNAHRVLSPASVLRCVDPLQLVSFSVIDDGGRFIADAEPSEFERASESCGLFELTRACDSTPLV